MCPDDYLKEAKNFKLTLIDENITDKKLKNELKNKAPVRCSVTKIKFDASTNFEEYFIKEYQNWINDFVSEGNATKYNIFIEDKNIGSNDTNVTDNEENLLPKHVLRYKSPTTENYERVGKFYIHYRTHNDTSEEFLDFKNEYKIIF